MLMTLSPPATGVDSAVVLRVTLLVSSPKKPSGAPLTVARPAWGYQLDRQVIEDTQVTAKRLGKISRSKSRTRRPSLSELERLDRKSVV